MHQDKLNNFPHIYYTNADHRVERKKYMEDQFNSLGLEYTRIGMLTGPKDGPPKKFLNKLTGKYSPSTSQWINWQSSLIFDFFQKWINTTKDPYFIFMEDDYDLSLVNRWHFTWDQFMNKLPYDWDCIQLGFESPDKICFYLHPTRNQYSLGASLLRRDYVEKLLSLHVIDEKYKFDYTIANSIYTTRESGIHDNMDYSYTSGGQDYFINQSGSCYSIPLIPINPYFIGISHGSSTVNVNTDWTTVSWHPKMSFVKCYEAYYEWWNNDRDNFTLDEFFTFGKNNDILMERDMSKWEDKYFYRIAIKTKLNYA